MKRSIRGTTRSQMPTCFNEMEERNMQALINGNEIFYTIHGQGRPMLLMHGGSGLDHTYFRPWLDSLGDRVELIYYDQLGHGRSTRPENYEGIGLDTWADEADALRASLGYDRIILFGHSFGGFIAQEYALRHGDHLAGLILCDTAPALGRSCPCTSISMTPRWVMQWMKRRPTAARPLATGSTSACPPSTSWIAWVRSPHRH
ncbi:MAG: alpha/beta fold hydrolase [Chloroflexi bacterium]|nr:MAG: alpha/beta fold hydrolase [Chloroflexota bacterium]